MDQLIVDFLLLLYSRCIVLIIVLLREYVDFPERLRKYITRFPRLAMVSVRFAVFSIVTYATAYLYSAIYIIPSIIILPFSIKYCRIFIERLYIGPYFGFYTALMELIFRFKFVLSGDVRKLSNTRPTLIILNHRYWLDWFYLSGFLLRLGLLTKHRVVTKYIFGNLVIYGWTCGMTMPIFVQRSTTDDEKTIRDTISHYHDMSLPVQIVMCPEGTALNTSNRRRDDEYSKKKGLELYKYIMHPRIKGFVEIVNALKVYKEFDICNITLGYVGGNISHEPGREEFRDLPSEIHYKVETVPYSVFSSFTEQELEEWLQRSWRDKEDCLKGFYQTNSFTTESSHVYKDDWTMTMKLLGYIGYGIMTLTVFLYYLPWTIIIVSVFGIISYCVHRFKGGWNQVILSAHAKNKKQ